MSESQKKANKKYYENNKHKWKDYHSTYRTKPNGQLKAILHVIKNRAGKKNLDFDLSVEDIIPPEYCPVLGIPILYGQTIGSPNSPSVDRFDNDKGYTKDNIRVISCRANKLKSDGKLEEFQKIVEYLLDK